MRTARIINIMNKKAIIIDYGIKQGAKIGQKVRVIEVGKTVSGIDGKSLGTLNAIKDTLEIVEVFENFSVCKKQTNKNNKIFYSLSQLEVFKPELEDQELNVNEADISNLTFPEILPIKKGDIVEILD